MRFMRLTDGTHARFARWLDEGSAIALDAAPWLGGRETGETLAIDPASILAPVEPSKIVCVGRNYRAHAAELGNEVPAEPLLFLKPPSALLGPGAEIEWPPESERVDYEGEIAVVIGRAIRRASEAQARASIFGLTCANDVTARDLQKRDVQFTRGKGFDTFCPCGPWIETEHGALDALSIRTLVDGEVKQNGRSAAMIWGIATLLSFISRVMTLAPGDLVLTGTPEGVGPVTPGGTVEVEIATVGRLTNRVGARPEA
jgi:2-keto-4-pentenoate hydratase/2-oxohepta-3-ene-1,7-dioic acid hydratase in catechol pathway